MALVAVGPGCTILGPFALGAYLMIPVVPSITWHVLVMATAVCMLACRLRPRVKQLFGARNAQRSQ